MEAALIQNQISHLSQWCVRDSDGNPCHMVLEVSILTDAEFNRLTVWPRVRLAGLVYIY